MNVLDLPGGTIEDESVLEDNNKCVLKQVWYKCCFELSFHRIRGPAVIHKNGREEWYRDGHPYTPTAHEKMMWELRKKNECS